MYGFDFPGKTFRVLKDREERGFGEYRTPPLVLNAWDRFGGYGVQYHFMLSYLTDVEVSMKTLDRITFNQEVMGGKPCIRGLRITVGTIVGLIAAGRTKDEVLKLYPYLEPEDIDQALAYAAWRVEEIDVPIITA
jgi:uncharacterized protein (DUF433 family)